MGAEQRGALLEQDTQELARRELAMVSACPRIPRSVKPMPGGNPVPARRGEPEQRELAQVSA